MNKLLLPLLALPILAASPARQQLSLAVPAPFPDAPFAAAPFATAAGPAVRPGPFQPAPLPNRDLNGPSAARASNEPNLAPSLFTNKTQYRGDGFSPGSTAQSEQERHAKPGAGFSLHMPLTPN